jgi:hypothetical protein
MKKVAKKTTNKKVAKKKSNQARLRKNPSTSLIRRKSVDEEKAFNLGLSTGVEDRKQGFWGSDLLPGYFAYISWFISRNEYEGYLNNWKFYILGYISSSKNEKQQESVKDIYIHLKPLLVYHIKVYYKILLNEKITKKEIIKFLKEGPELAEFIIYNLIKLKYIKKSRIGDKYIVIRNINVLIQSVDRFDSLMKKTSYFKDIEDLLNQNSKFKYKE